MIRIFQWREIYCRSNTSVGKKKEIQNSSIVRITVKDLSRKFNHLSKPFKVEKISQFDRFISSTRVG